MVLIKVRQSLRVIGKNEDLPESLAIKGAARILG